MTAGQTIIAAMFGGVGLRFGLGAASVVELDRFDYGVAAALFLFLAHVAITAEVEDDDDD